MLNQIKFITVFLILGSLLGAAAVPVSAQSPAKFLAPRAYDGGVSFATGDFNSDGKLDVVSSKVMSLTLTTGDGAGGFPNPPTTVYACQNFSSTAIKRPVVGDFNGDGKPDIAAFIDDGTCTGNFSRTLIVLPGNGAGGFGSPIFNNVTNFFFTAEQAAVADFNNDSKLDILLSNVGQGGDNLAVFFGTGTGTFAAPVLSTVTSMPFEPLSVGDFTGDGKPDIAYAPFGQFHVAVRAGNGDGTFAAPLTTDNNFIGRKTTAGDFNNDGKLDLAVVQDRDFDTTLRILLGVGNGAFQTGSSLTLTDVQGFVNALRSGDFNNDGKRDVVLSIGTRTFLVKGNGDGTFATLSVHGAGGGQLFAGDFNNDGLLDLGATQTLGSQGSQLGTSNEFAVLLNSSDGFLTAPIAELPFGGDELAAADFNNDGLKDLAMTGDALLAEIIIFLQDPGARLKKSSGIAAAPIVSRLAAKPEGGVPITPRTITTGDYNNDGKTDVVAAGYTQTPGSPNVIVARNDGAGNLTLVQNLTVAGRITRAVSADFNADGKLDLAFSVNRDTLPNAVSVVVVAFGTGTGTFGAPVGYLSSNNLVGTSLTAADFNGDNRADLAVTLNNAKTQIMLNNGSGAFAEGALYDLAVTPTKLAAADLNADGKADLVIAGHNNVGVNSARVVVMNGNGNGTFAAAAEYPTTANHPQRLTVDDLNGDGKKDVAVTNNGVVTVLENDGSGGLSRKTFWAPTGALLDIVSVDFDNDSKIDLVTSSFIDGFSNLSFLSNITEAAAPRKVPFDFDGDGKTDISIFRPAGGEWWINRSSTGQTVAAQFGAGTDKLAPADFTGDGKADIGFFRPATGEWFILRSENGSFLSFTFGTSGDVPTFGDFDADGKADPTVFRPSTGEWFILKSTGGVAIVTFGTTGDVPVPADYDGDGRADIAIFRVADGSWWYLRSSDAQYRVFRFGVSTDKPVAGDYTGDGKADIAVYRPGSGEWFVLRSEDNSFYSVPFGTSGDLPVPGDYDGDGKFDTAVFRPSNVTWYVNRSTAGLLIASFGATGDRPVPGAVVP